MTVEPADPELLHGWDIRSGRAAGAETMVVLTLTALGGSQATFLIQVGSARALGEKLVAVSSRGDASAR